MRLSAFFSLFNRQTPGSFIHKAKAAFMNFKDYEDALQSVCAARMKMNFIVTRNIKDFANSKVAAITPSELIDRI